ncbi:hypothetical protein COCMIDRAFT_108333 [Bipolaris oryzae ATCC 44560]|uniref:Nudix hydrolase domain-containing protein n=1 Tax=Bipolaris oryzae ATCC 44560 TaxID=930090 RepID=W6ZA74_COCMI|nr:uncharacterized protein COCMIDRAFT_108333 [Bipolaris oryzae ATCC 44560]EUC40621.1 hypothetical protein COCMIDRAFT_108333 [Bipolaris oryzae ATCC 44560]
MSRRNSAMYTTHPLTAQFDSAKFMVGGGVAIFHLATGRVILCSYEQHGRKVYFLPKGRRDAGEESGTGAEREGYEESGYRNRLLPLPTRHCQPQAHPRVHAATHTAEPVLLQLMPLREYQYVVYWYIAETLPPSLEGDLETEPGSPYKLPPRYPQNLSLRERIAMEPQGYEPRHHEGTGVDNMERQFKSELCSVEDAIKKLGQGHMMGEAMADVVRKGWEGIQKRFEMEDAATQQSPEAV